MQKALFEPPNYKRYLVWFSNTLGIACDASFTFYTAAPIDKCSTCLRSKPTGSLSAGGRDSFSFTKTSLCWIFMVGAMYIFLSQLSIAFFSCLTWYQTIKPIVAPFSLRFGDPIGSFFVPYFFSYSQSTKHRVFFLFNLIPDNKTYIVAPFFFGLRFGDPIASVFVPYFILPAG